MDYLPAEYISYSEEAVEEVSEILKVTKEEHFDAVRTKLPELDYKMGLTTCSGDKDFYLELLKDFTELTIKEELTRFLKEDDAQNYCIRIHGFKNNAYSIGAKEIGDLAFEMEKLSKDFLSDSIPELQKHMFELYDSVCRRYNEIIVL